MIKSLAAPGIYRIVRLEQHQQFLVSAQKTIAEIEVTGTPVKTALPTVLPIPTREYPMIKPSEVQNIRVIYFANQFPGTQTPYVGIDFVLNALQYDVTQVNLRGRPQLGGGMASGRRRQPARRCRGPSVPYPREPVRGDLGQRQAVGARHHQGYGLDSDRIHGRYPHALQGIH
jgi:hypothetical protein